MRYAIVKLWYKGVSNIKTRPIEIGEYQEIVKLMVDGFIYREEGKEKIFRPNSQIALALQLEASLGLRIGDVLNLTLNNFKSGKLETIEEKTGKLQYRDVNSSVINAVYQYALENNI